MAKKWELLVQAPSSYLERNLQLKISLSKILQAWWDRQYYRNCHIEGTVDFIFGSSTALFENCTIFCKNHGYITAPSTDENTGFGFVFLNCKITGSADESSFYLGRPWRPYGKSVFINCDLGSLIKPEGWDNWRDPEKENTAFFAEYKNYGESADPAGRVKWSHQLTEDESSAYTPGKSLT